MNFSSTIEDAANTAAVITFLAVAVRVLHGWVKARRVKGAQTPTQSSPARRWSVKRILDGLIIGFMLLQAAARGPLSAPLITAAIMWAVLGALYVWIIFGSEDRPEVQSSERKRE